MVARNFSVQEIPYSSLLQVPDDSGDFITLEELKPVISSQPGLQQVYQHHQPTYYELTTLSKATCSANNMCEELCQEYRPTNGKHMELQAGDASSNCRKRKFSHHSHQETISDLDEDNSEDGKSIKTNDDSKKQNHSEIEKRRRDKMNTYITELSTMVPMCYAMSRKLDKLTVLRMAVQHLKTIRGTVHSYTEGHYKPSFLSDQELKHLILQATDGFLFVVGCDRGRILYTSETVSKVLNYDKTDLVGQSFFDILHPKDVAKVKEQLSSSDLNPRDRLIDAKTMLPVKTDVPQGASVLSPGARRSFFCRMKCQIPPDEVKEEADTTTDKRYNVIQCTGYLKSWEPSKLGVDDLENEADTDSCHLSCLVAIGRILPHISLVVATMQSRPHVQPIQFVSRHTLDGKFLFIDQRATLVLGLLPQELLGSSIYEYCHRDDIGLAVECHKRALQTAERVTSKVYRFRTKDGGYVRLQTEWKAFKNPWTKEIDYLIAKNTLIMTDYQIVESSAGRSEAISTGFEFCAQSTSGKNIQTLINSHIEASKIGRQVAEQVIDSQKPSNLLPESTITITSNEHLISTSCVQAKPPTNQILTEFDQQQYTQMRENAPISEVSSEVCNQQNEGIIEMMEDAVRDAPNDGQPTEGNDEAAMAVIMSLLEADAGLGGPVDFSGLPWPLP